MSDENKRNQGDKQKGSPEAQRDREAATKGNRLSRRTKDIAKANGMCGQSALQSFAAESVLWALTQV
jgi:hypothetical protein